MEVSQLDTNSPREGKGSHNIENSVEISITMADSNNSRISSVNVPVSDTGFKSNIKEHIVSSNTSKCRCVKASDSSHAFPPCYFCSSKAAEVFVKTHKIPQIRLASSLPTIRNHTDHMLVRGFNSNHSFQNSYIFPCNYHENHGVSYIAGEEHCPSPSQSEANRSKDMPKVASIFCKHRLRKMFISIPVGILATIGILGLESSFATLFNVSILLIILVFYPIFCLIDFGMDYLSSRLKIIRKIRSRKRTVSELSEDPPHSMSDGEIHRRPSHTSRLSVISNLPSIAEEDDDDDRSGDLYDPSCNTASGTVFEHTCRECEKLCGNSVCSHRTSNLQRGITLCIPPVIVQ